MPLPLCPGLPPSAAWFRLDLYGEEPVETSGAELLEDSEDSEEIASAIAELAVGESRFIGGGASESWKLTRIARPSAR